MLSSKEVEDSFEAVPAYIVADKRDSFGRRLGQAAFVLLLLFFVISSYVQSARNGAELDESRRQRNILVNSQKTIAVTVDAQGRLIVALQEIITRQNTALRTAGLPVEPVPNLQELIDKSQGLQNPHVRPTPTPGNSPRSESKSSPTPTPRPQTSPKPSASPRPKPSPKPSPSATSNPVTQLVCDLTFICLSK